MLRVRKSWAWIGSFTLPFVCVAMAASAGCGLIQGLGDLSIVDDAGGSLEGGGDGGSGFMPPSEASTYDVLADALDDAQVDAPPNRCPAGRGPVMIEVPTLDGRTFCIDSTEVTEAQYNEFLRATAADASGQSPTCTWNDTYAPTCAFQPDVDGTKPVVCIDWCDAQAFCAWAGKRMCGKIGGGPLPSFFGDVFDPAKSQWHAACTHNGARDYPYGSAYDAAACNGADRDAGGPVAAGSLAGCAGGFAGIFDMSGNVLELEDACDESDAGPRAGICHGRGGSFGDDGKGVRCDSNLSFIVLRRDATGSSIGIRCCAD